MKQFKLLNNITGWIVWFIATYVYVSTIEQTASWWDCGEYISTSYKLMVGHEPGAPMFQLIARVFSLIASSPAEVAKWINCMSALASSFTILFLFWSITAFGRKLLVKKEDDFTLPKIVAILFSGVVGGLAYTFSDSFWFSAVEGEVYAMSSFFTALVFWAMLKWEEAADRPHADRWIILIAFLMGCSIGVHLLNLLTIPALAIIYYFKKYSFSWFGLFKALIVSLLLLIVVQYGVIQRVVWLASKFELFFVNGMGLPFGTGVAIYAFVLIALVLYGLKNTRDRNLAEWNTVILCFVFLMIGYSAYAQTIIRSKANTPLDESNPEHVFALLSYLNREQYGDRPLFYGHFYNAKMEGREDGSPIYYKDDEKGNYVKTGYKSVAKYEKKNSGFFPRMYSQDKNHIKVYKEVAGIRGDKKPSFAQNLTFFFKYQLGHMYLRYFMWNFAGRQNDIQGHGNITDGNWISGFSFLDDARLGPQDQIPLIQDVNKAKNKFYLIPLILGLIGFFYQSSKNKNDSIVVGLLFLLTGIAIVIYLNQYPYQPRERDYAYAASFYAFAIWIGLAVIALYDWISAKINPIGGATLASVVCLSAPAIMAKEGWNDHDRSNRFAARDLAINYLQSCDKNAILFTNGDNDTFPLWYAQDVEGVRTDVRVVNLSLLNTDWYINQMRRKAYESDALPFHLKENQLRGETRLQLPVYDKFKDFKDIKWLIDEFVSKDGSEFTIPTTVGNYNYLPTRKLSLNVDTALVIKNGIVAKGMEKEVLPVITWELKGNAITRNSLMILDILAHNEWKRPVYFAITVGRENFIGLEKYFQMDGFAFKIVPVLRKPFDGQLGFMRNDKTYDLLMNQFKWGNMKDPKVYQGAETERMCGNYRNIFARLANSLSMEGKKDSAIKVLDRCLEELPSQSIPYNYSAMSLVDAYFRAGNIEKGKKLNQELFNQYKRDLIFYSGLNKKLAKYTEDDPKMAYTVVTRLSQLARVHKQTEQSDAFDREIKELESKLAMSPVGRTMLEE